MYVFKYSELNEKQINKRVKSEWKRLTDEEQSKWCEVSHKKELTTKKKNPQPKNNEKQRQQNNKQQKQAKQNDKTDE